MSDPQRVAVFHHSLASILRRCACSGTDRTFRQGPAGAGAGSRPAAEQPCRAQRDRGVCSSERQRLLLPRLIPIGDPELDERVGGALDRIDEREPIPMAIGPDERLLRLASIVPGEGTAERFRLAADLARTLDALLVEEIDPRRLKEAVAETNDLARHWEHSLARLQLIYENWPHLLREQGAIDLAERRNRLLHRLADQWKDKPPPGFTVAAGITTAAPAVAALVARVARMPEGSVVLPGLWLPNIFPEVEWERLARTRTARRSGASAIPFEAAPRAPRRCAQRGSGMALVRRCCIVAIARARGGERDGCAGLLTQMGALAALRARLSGIRLAELPDPASEAQAIALALREALETPGKTAALVTPDRQLAGRAPACSRVGASTLTIAPASRFPRLLPEPCCWALPALRRKNSRRCRCSPCSSIRWSAAKGTTGLPGWMQSVNWTSSSVDRDRPRPWPDWMESSPRFANGSASGRAWKGSMHCCAIRSRLRDLRRGSRARRNRSPATGVGGAGWQDGGGTACRTRGLRSGGNADGRGR